MHHLMTVLHHPRVQYSDKLAPPPHANQQSANDLRGQAGEKVTELCTTRKKKKISLVQNSITCPETARWVAGVGWMAGVEVAASTEPPVRPHHIKMRKTPWGEFCAPWQFPVKTVAGLFEPAPSPTLPTRGREPDIQEAP
jgi:hypothetical protein